MAMYCLEALYYPSFRQVFDDSSFTVSEQPLHGVSMLHAMRRWDVSRCAEDGRPDVQASGVDFHIEVNVQHMGTPTHIYRFKHTQRLQRQSTIIG